MPLGSGHSGQFNKALGIWIFIDVRIELLLYLKQYCWLFKWSQTGVRERRRGRTVHDIDHSTLAAAGRGYL